MPYKICINPTCGKSFFSDTGEFLVNPRKYCSHLCRGRKYAADVKSGAHVKRPKYPEDEEE